MKKITFKVNTQITGSLAALLKEVSKLHCRIQIDFENGIVTVQQVSDEVLDTVVDLIDTYFTLLGVDIDNSVEAEVATQVTDEVSLTPEIVPQVVGPQSEDDLVIKKVEFENQKVEELINKLLRTIYWAMHKKEAHEAEIARYLYTIMTEISLKYGNEPTISYAVGDIVDCNYGQHLPGEVNGGHVPAIVCNISASGTYCVPITMSEGRNSTSYVEFNALSDVSYTTTELFNGLVLLDKGRYVCSSRFTKVIGRVNTPFFISLLSNLAPTFNFLPPVTDSGKKEVQKKPEKPKFSITETTLMEVIGAALDNVDSNVPPEKQLSSFLKDIGMPANPLLWQSFMAGFHVKKITFENIAEAVRSAHKDISEEQLKTTLKNLFKTWESKHPELAECPSISLMTLIKVFTKKYMATK